MDWEVKEIVAWLLRLQITMTTHQLSQNVSELEYQELGSCSRIMLKRHWTRGLIDLVHYDIRLAVPRVVEN